MRTKKLLTILTLIATLAVTGALPVVLLAVPESAPRRQAPPVRERAAVRALPPFPEDIERAPTDWASVDWNKEIILEEDREAYYRELDRLEAEGRLDEAKNIPLPSKRRLSDLAVMERRGVPEAVREAVREQVEADGLHDGGVNTLSARLRALAPLTTGNADQQPSDTLMPPEQRLDIRDAKPLDWRAVGSVPPLGPNDVTITMPQRAVEQQSNTVPTLQQPQSRPPRKILQSDDSWLHKLARIIMPAAQAYYEATTPLISYYDGIEDDPVAYALYYLSQTQNDDGSWGEADRYALTARIAVRLSEFGLIVSDQYAQAVAFLTAHEPANIREVAVKIRLLAGLGEPYGDLLDTVWSAQNNDSGFGLQVGYPSDLETTLEALWALYAVNETSNLAPALAYILESVSEDGSVRYHPEAAPSYHLVTKTARYLGPLREVSYQQGGVTIHVQDTVNRLLGFLEAHYDAEAAALEQTDDVIDMFTTLAVWQTYDTQTDAQAALVAQARGRQLFDGGFGPLAATVAALEALAQPDVAVTHVTSTTGLVNKESAELQITLANQGYAPTGALRLYLFVDGFKINDGYDLAGSGIVLAPQETTTVMLSLNAGFMQRLTGDTDITLYAEAEEDAGYDNNWLEQTFSVSPAADGTPALPVYYIAFKHEISNQPVLNVRWAKKTDPRRLNYIITFRELGTSQWLYLSISNDWNGAFLGGFEEGVTYEVAPGVLHLGAQTYTAFSDFTTITMSADEAQYTGNVAGVATVDAGPASGVHTWGYGVSATTDSDGNFYYYNRDNGVSAAWVDEDYYEPFTTRFPININATTTDVRLFTRLKPDTEPPAVTYFEMRSAVSGVVRNQQTRELLADFSDNVQVKEADFYYWEPAEEVWRYLGTQARSPNGNTAILQWYVPSELLGGGYKIRAIAYDWKGNASEPAEWGPFTIIDGTPPTGSVAVAGLENNQWALGVTKTISWEVAASNPLAGELRFRLQPFNATIANVAAAASGTVDYTLPLSASYVSDEAFVDMQACDVNNNCTTFTSPSFATVDVSTPPPYPWQEPQILSALDSPVFTSRYLRKAFHNNDGSIEIVYAELDISTAHSRLWYRKLVNETWQDPVLLVEDADSVNYRDVEALKGHDGSIHISYQHEFTGGFDSLDLSEIYYVHLQNSTVTKTRISYDNTLSRSSQLAVDSANNVFIIWRQGYSYSQQSGKTVLYYRQKSAAGSWNAEETLTNDWTGYAALALEGGIPIIAYNDSTSLTILKKGASGWSDPVSVFEIDNMYYPHLFVNSDETYEFFYWHGAAPNWQYNIYESQFSVDYQNLTAEVIFNNTIVSLKSNEMVNAYAIAKIADKNYHLAYIKRINIDGSYHPYAYHAVVDNSQTYFNARVSSLAMYIDDYNIILAASGDKVSVYFYGYTGGTSQTVYNRADYGPIINYRFSPEAPLANGAVVEPYATLSWSVSGGPVDSYDVKLSQNPDALATVASEVTESTINVSSLIGDAAYYWQVVGHYNSHTINSNIWSFQTTLNSPPVINSIDPSGVQYGFDNNFTITWNDADSETDAAIALFYDADSSGQDGTNIVQSISEDNENDSYDWNFTNVPAGSYYVYGVIDDGFNEPVASYSNGVVVIEDQSDTCTPPATGDWVVAKSCTMESSATAPANVIVQNNAVLTVPNGVTLDIDLAHFYLFVQYGSGVLVREGGSVQ